MLQAMQRCIGESRCMYPIEHRTADTGNIKSNPISKRNGLGVQYLGKPLLLSLSTMYSVPRCLELKVLVGGNNAQVHE